MITEFFLTLAGLLQEWFVGLFGTDDPPEWMSAPVEFFADLAVRVSGLGAWFPLPLLGIICAGLLAIWAGFWIVKGIRWLWGLTPLSGGS